MNCTGPGCTGTSSPKCNTDRDLSAFEASALPYFRDVYRTARYVTGHSAGAEDLTQDVFLQAWKSFHRFEPGTNCKAWLMTILFYMCQHHRRQMRRSKVVSWAPQHDDLCAIPPAQLSARMDQPLVQALHALPAPYRSVLVLAEVYEYSYSEIAVIMRVPIGTVMSRLSRGKKRLRDLLYQNEPRHCPTPAS